MPSYSSSNSSYRPGNSAARSTGNGRSMGGGGGGASGGPGGSYSQQGSYNQGSSYPPHNPPLAAADPADLHPERPRGMYHRQGRQQDQRNSTHECQPDQDHGTRCGGRRHERRICARRAGGRAASRHHRPAREHTDGSAATVSRTSFGFCAHGIYLSFPLVAIGAGKAEAASCIYRRRELIGDRLISRVQNISNE